MMMMNDDDCTMTITTIIITLLVIISIIVIIMAWILLLLLRIMMRIPLTIILIPPSPTTTPFVFVPVFITTSVGVIITLIPPPTTTPFVFVPVFITTSVGATLISLAISLATSMTKRLPKVVVIRQKKSVQENEVVDLLELTPKLTINTFSEMMCSVEWAINMVACCRVGRFILAVGLPLTPDPLPLTFETQ